MTTTSGNERFSSSDEDDGDTSSSRLSVTGPDGRTTTYSKFLFSDPDGFASEATTDAEQDR